MTPANVTGAVVNVSTIWMPKKPLLLGAGPTLLADVRTAVEPETPVQTA